MLRILQLQAAEASPEPAETVADWGFLELFSIKISEALSLTLELSLPLVVLVGIIAFVWYWNRQKRIKHFGLVELDFKLGGLGSAKFKPNYNDIQIAHKIWTELVTRKAAIKIDPEHDVIVEVYASWYALFGRIRQLVADVPAELLRREESTRILVRIATDSLNLGLRPHLTVWQARYRNWYQNRTEALKSSSPQEVQRQFPEYDTLIADMARVNDELIDYAEQFRKIVDGKS